MSTTPQRNVIYYNNNSNPISLTGISGLPYTDVIVAFLVPGGNFTLAGQGGFTGAYDGITSLIDLTNGLAQNLPPGRNIITHAPQPPYFDPDARFNNAYMQIWEGTGSNISWFNCQFCNNPFV